jgi:hypothetical protein
MKIVSHIVTTRVEICSPPSNAGRSLRAIVAALAHR